MSRIEWNKPGERFFEAGVDRGVLYPRAGRGVPWNGLVSVSENSSGGDMEQLYFDGVKYLDVSAAEDFQATLEAYSAPPEFDASDGQKTLAPGLYVTQQPRTTFDLSYRTLIGNDLVGENVGYKIHLVYNCTAAPAPRNSKTLSQTIEPQTRSWGIFTVPPPASTFKPTAHIVLDSTRVDPYLLDDIEAVLYGRDASEGQAAMLARIPTVDEIVTMLSNVITDTIEDFI